MYFHFTSTLYFSASNTHIHMYMHTYICTCIQYIHIYIERERNATILKDPQFKSILYYSSEFLLNTNGYGRLNQELSVFICCKYAYQNLSQEPSLGMGKIAQWVRALILQNRDMSLNSKHPYKNVCNTTIAGPDIGRSSSPLATQSSLKDKFLLQGKTLFPGNKAWLLDKAT